MVASGYSVDKNYLQDYFYFLVYDAYGELIAKNLFLKEDFRYSRNEEAVK